MLKKTTIILLLLVTTGFAEFSIGGAGGVLNFGENDEWGYGAGLRTDFRFFKRFGASLSVEKFISNKEYFNNLEKPRSSSETKTTAVSLSILYYLKGVKFKPYLLCSFGYHVGHVNDTFYSYDQQSFELKDSWDSDHNFRGPEVGIGGGLSIPLSLKFSLDLNITYLMPEESNDHARCFLGIIYKL